MALPVGKLCTNKNFLLKIAVLVFGVSAIFLDWPALHRLINGSEFGYLTVISALLITYMFSESTRVTEICLLIAALTQLIEATVARIELTRESNFKFGLHLTSNIAAAIIIVLDIFLLVTLKNAESEQ